MSVEEELQPVLAGEHAAVYVFSVLAAQTSQSTQRALYDDLVGAWTEHRNRRDALVARIGAAGLTPVPAAPSYELPNAVANPQQVLAAALVVEKRVTDTYGTLVARTVENDRRQAVRWLDESAVRELRFRGRPEIFPGSGGLAGSGAAGDDA